MGRTILCRRRQWSECAAMLAESNVVPRMEFHKVGIRQGKVTVYLKFMDEDSERFMFDQLKPRLWNMQRDVFEHPEDRGTHMTVSLGRFADMPMPENVENDVKRAVEECFDSLGKPIPLSPAVLCLC